MSDSKRESSSWVLCFLFGIRKLGREAGTPSSSRLEGAEVKGFKDPPHSIRHLMPVYRLRTIQLNICSVVLLQQTQSHVFKCSIGGRCLNDLESNCRETGGRLLCGVSRAHFLHCYTCEDYRSKMSNDDSCINCSDGILVILEWKEFLWKHER